MKCTKNRSKPPHFMVQSTHSKESLACLPSSSTWYVQTVWRSLRDLSSLFIRIVVWFWSLVSAIYKNSKFGEICLSFYFKSKTGKVCHVVMFHRRQKRAHPKKISCDTCGPMFSSTSCLNRHKKSAKHDTRPLPKETKVKRQKTKQRREHLMKLYVRWKVKIVTKKRTWNVLLSNALFQH